MKNNIEQSLINLIPKQGFSLGNDLVFLPDFELSFNPLFQQKVYTKREIEYCKLFNPSILRYASTWAAKEATYKAIKQIYSEALPFKKIEILREKISGRPSVHLPENLIHLNISLTISHDGDYVWAGALVKNVC
ncbi:holo-ACP synthase [Pedobacter cryophilus]|uniref:4'-phosphopantetheinyl transferase superfamily protein n=1 Tax=Pedobacter cryophilus TaxID=2571271 RepID=A0A4U1C4J0_9SPHI|nr:4'-phosphopantetheinyl transferase superfamily protein [Pedobacter cryophilus]TKC00279.1 4'-phosphopantetheinyl transferase superfamily protein [Pedobacter cryophilus]